MPIYEYRCTLCGQEHEALQKASDPQLVDCPACGKPGLQKLLTAAGFQLKGSGWYATDFKSSGKKPEEKKPEKKEAKPETKPESKPESKPETKSEAPA
jgi:putative FmdB family regulatory protein